MRTGSASPSSPICTPADPIWGWNRVRRVVDTAQALNSDLIVILGDFFATHRFVTERVPHPVWAAELGHLKARLGVYAILGNHDL